MIEQTLIDRLEILEGAGQISTDIKQHVLDVLQQFETEHGVHLTEENASQFVTHYAAACQRISSGNPITEVPDSVREVVSAHPQMESIAAKMFQNLSEPTEAGEVALMTTHVCLLLGNVG